VVAGKQTGHYTATAIATPGFPRPLTVTWILSESSALSWPWSPPLSAAL